MDGHWIRRLGSPRSGFRYVDERGKSVTGSAKERIELLRVPPAWRDVHVAPSARSSVQAWGFDARGRKQYRYNEHAVEQRELRKYHRVRSLATRLPRLRRALRDAASDGSQERDAVAATVVRLITETFCRVGGERYVKENGTYGITTIKKSHVRFDKRGVWFAYVGKGDIKQRQRVTAPDLVAAIRRQMKTPGPRLFRYRNEGVWHDLTARDVSRYLKQSLGAFCAKDFRTWGGTLRAATVLAELGPAESTREATRNVALAMRLVSSELGNTPTVCRASYVHPIIIARYLDAGETIAVRASRAGARDRGQAHSPEERALIAFLDKHFPDRRGEDRLAVA